MGKLVLKKKEAAPAAAPAAAAPAAAGAAPAPAFAMSAAGGAGIKLVLKDAKITIDKVTLAK